MQPTPRLLSMGIHFEPVSASDLNAWLDTKQACYRAYVDTYYGGWNDEMQIRLNTKSFESACSMTCFQKITRYGRTVGFMGYNELEDRIQGVTIHMYAEYRNQGIGSGFLRELISLSQSTGKPIYLKVFKSNPAQYLYSRHNFSIYNETVSHFLMKFTPT